MLSSPIHLFLVDDDQDDCLFFQEAISELPIPTLLTVRNNGEELINYLNTPKCRIPNILFMDLNMPLKNGFECLREIKSNLKLKRIPIVILSTSFDSVNISWLFENGAKFYIRKPIDSKQLNSLIHQAIQYSLYDHLESNKDNFVLNGNFHVFAT